VSSTTVGHLLHALGYRLQALRKTQEGTSHPIATPNSSTSHDAAAFLQRQQPVISVDTKKKELVGGISRMPDRNVSPPARRNRSACSDSLATRSAKRSRTASTHGAQRSVGERGRDHDTPAFAVASNRQWWTMMGRAAYPHARRVGSSRPMRAAGNGYRSRAWKQELATVGRRPAPPDSRLAFPPGTSKWNRSSIASSVTHRELARSCAPHLRDGRRAHWPHANGGRTARQAKLDKRRTRQAVSSRTRDASSRTARPSVHGDWNYD